MNIFYTILPIWQKESYKQSPVRPYDYDEKIKEKKHKHIIHSVNQNNTTSYINIIQTNIVTMAYYLEILNTITNVVHVLR